jgi:hypothetical protein
VSDFARIEGLRTTSESLHAAGFHRLADPVDAAIRHLNQWSPLEWVLWDGDECPWRITQVNATTAHATIERHPEACAGCGALPDWRGTRQHRPGCEFA